MKNLVDTRFFVLRGLCREAAQTSADRIGETRSGLSPRGAALASGMVGKKKKCVGGAAEGVRSDPKNYYTVAETQIPGMAVYRK